MNHFLALPQKATKFSTPRIAASQLGRLRLNWFMLGAVSGVLFASAMNHLSDALTGNSLDYTPSWAQERVAHKSEKQSLLKPLEEIASVVATEDGNASPLTAANPVSTKKEPSRTQQANIALSDTQQHDSHTTYPRTQTLTVAKRDTLIDMITELGVSYVDADIALKGLKGKFNPRNIRVNQTIHVTLDKPADRTTPVVTKMQIDISPIKHVALKRIAEGKYSASEQTVPLKTEITRNAGTITSSLYQTAANAGVHDGVIMELIKAYAYNVDLQREIRSGDKIDVMYEQKKTADGKIVDYGKIHYANLTLNGKHHKIYRYEDKKGNIGFYDEKGESIIRALLKTPVDGARISSGYGKRKHPILGYTKMHKGTDFAAPTGTPIYAAGDGIVEFRGTRGGYGKYLRIRHNSTYKTAYAHMSRYAKGIGKGKRVKQGQVIAYVGSTGRSTGPHLHYEVIKHGKQVNPMRERFKTGRILKGTELASFKSHMNQLHTQLAALPTEQKIARAE